MYYVYVNWHARGNRIRIHTGPCGHCKYGKGQAGGTDPDRGKWLGPFDSIPEAESAAGSGARKCKCVN